jgi:hypothetical protein
MGSIPPVNAADSPSPLLFQGRLTSQVAVYGSNHYEAAGNLLRREVTGGGARLYLPLMRKGR